MSAESDPKEVWSEARPRLQYDPGGFTLIPPGPAPVTQAMMVHGQQVIATNKFPLKRLVDLLGRLGTG